MGPFVVADQCLQCEAGLRRAAKFCPSCGAEVVLDVPGPSGEGSSAAAKGGVMNRVKSLRQSVGFLDKGAVLGAEVIGKIGSLKKGLSGATRHVLDVRTEDRRDTLEADGEDMLWVYAELISNDPDLSTHRLTRTIDFSVEGSHADWVTLGRAQMKNGMKVIRVKAEPPAGRLELDDAEIRIVASVGVGEAIYLGSASLVLEEAARMKISIRD